MLDDRQADAWMKLVLSDSPMALATYLLEGGEVDKKVRKILALVLMGERRFNGTGSRDRWRDYVTYTEVESIMVSKNISKTQACRQYAESTHREQRAVEYQYGRGSKVFNSVSLDIEEEVPITEK